MSVDPNSIRSLSNDPAYTQALDYIQNFEKNPGENIVQSASVIVTDGAKVYYDPNVPQAAKDALHHLVQNVLGQVQASSRSPEVVESALLLYGMDESNYKDSLSPP